MHPFLVGPGYLKCFLIPYCDPQNPYCDPVKIINVTLSSPDISNVLFVVLVGGAKTCMLDGVRIVVYA